MVGVLLSVCELWVWNFTTHLQRAHQHCGDVSEPASFLMARLPGTLLAYWWPAGLPTH